MKKIGVFRIVLHDECDEDFYYYVSIKWDKEK